MDDQAIIIYTPADTSLAAIRMTLNSEKGSTEELDCKSTTTGFRGQFKMSSRSPYAKGVVRINAILTFSPGWTPYDKVISGNGYDEISDPAWFDDSTLFSLSPSICFVMVKLSSGRGSFLERGGAEPKVLATIKVRSKNIRDAMLEASAPSPLRRLTGVEDMLVSATHR